MLNLTFLLDIQVEILSRLFCLKFRGQSELLSLVVASIHMVFKTKRLDGVVRGVKALG